MRLPFVITQYVSHLGRVTITPEIARYLLDNHNKRNRQIKESAVTKYARDMKMGAFVYNGEPIIFGDDSNLTSGQHRLLACIEANTSFETDITFGVPVASAPTIDTGVPRSAADAIRLATGDKNTQVKVKIANGIKKIVNPHRDGLSVAMAQSIMDDFQKGISTVTELVKGKSLFGRAPCAAAFALAATAYPNKTRELLTSLLNGQTTSTTAASLLRYVLANFEGNTEDQISSKVLYAIYNHFEAPRVRLQAAKVTKKEEVLTHFLDAIKAKKDLESLQYFAPKRA